MMLVFTRKANETVVLRSPDLKKPIVISINYVRGQRVLLGVSAPEDVRVLRGELENRPPKKKAA